MDTVTAEFLREIDSFLDGSGMTATAFGVAALKDPCFVSDVRDGGRAPNGRTMQKVRDFMASHSSPPTVPDQSSEDSSAERTK